MTVLTISIKNKNLKIMKKLMMIAIALVTLNATSQNKEKGKEFLKDLSVEEIATLRTKKMTLHLDLTESQQTEVNAVLLEEAKHSKQQRAKFEEKNKDKTTEKPSKEERLEMMNARLDRQIELKKQMKDILNADQYEKWSKSLSKKSKMRHKKRGGDKSGKRR